MLTSLSCLPAGPLVTPSDSHLVVQYTNLIPPVSVEVLSYGRFMQLLKAKQIKRIQVMGDGTAAIVDVSPP